jgi:hypothetical protein
MQLVSGESKNCVVWGKPHAFDVRIVLWVNLNGFPSPVYQVSCDSFMPPLAESKEKAAGNAW